MIKITADHPYATQIRNFFQTEFPVNTEKTSSDILELITNAILATGKVRLGPKPSIESLYAIRQTISNRMAENLPIPFLMPWGSEKPASFQTVDMAEVVAFKTLICLQARVKSVYSPGIHIRIRVEDATAPSLFYTRKEQARLDAKIYTDSLKALNVILGTRSFVQLVPESDMVNEDDFQEELDKLFPTFHDYMMTSSGVTEPQREFVAAYQDLKSLGWTGIIPDEQRNHYLGTYRKLYNLSDREALSLLARYFAQSLARRRMNMLGNLDWKDYLGLSFVGPIPGEPVGVAPKRVYYRTMPENMSQRHIAPWRAKGYFRIADGIPKVKLASWSEEHEYNSATVTLTNEEQSVEVRTDYEVL